MQRHTETKKRWLRLFKKHGSDQWQCLISCEWAQTLWDQNIFPSLCVCVILTCSQPPTLSWSVRVPPMGGAVESQWEEKGQSRRNFLRQKEVWQMHKHTEKEREGGREGAGVAGHLFSGSPPLPAGFVQAVCTLQCSASLGGAPSLCSSTQLYCLGGWVCRVQGAFPGSVLPAYGALHLGSNA